MFRRKNCGMTDRVARIVIAVLIGVAYVMGYVQWVVAMLLGVFGLIMLVTGAAGYCALYEPLGIDTHARD
jgi:hypothetical protein